MYTILYCMASRPEAATARLASPRVAINSNIDSNNDHTNHNNATTTNNHSSDSSRNSNTSHNNSDTTCPTSLV